ncbi:DUF6668 family protein [Streptomyces sp. NPDC029554]|uniref:DUF6668 family protein n=1 Tax=Streptomyces sp. NPDC029554 TaxID=3155126 RepID=UPI0033F15CC7
MSTPAAVSGGWVRGPVVPHPEHAVAPLPEQQPRQPDAAPPLPPAERPAEAGSWARPPREQRPGGGPAARPPSGVRSLHTTALRPVPSHEPQQAPAGGRVVTGHFPTDAGRDGLVAWVNAHGGAGATTFAAALGGIDAGNGWPDVGRGQPRRMFLLARTHAAGLRAAGRALKELHNGNHPVGMELLALVLVADAPGRLPLQLSRRVRVLRSATTTVTVPWIPAWRVGEPASKAPREIDNLAALIRSGSAAQGDRR